MITLAKQLSAAYFPISAVGVSTAVYDTICPVAHEAGLLGHGFTYGGHPVGAAVAMEALAVYEEMGLPTHVDRLSAHLANRLQAAAALDVVGDVRVTGLMAGVEMIDDTPLEKQFGRRIVEAAEQRGVLLRAIENVVAISPPLNVAEAELDRIVDVLLDSIAAVSPCGGLSAASERD